MNNNRTIIRGMFAVIGLVITGLIILTLHGSNTSDFIKTLVALVPSTFASVLTYTQSAKTSTQVKVVHAIAAENHALVIDTTNKVLDIKASLDATLKDK